MEELKLTKTDLKVVYKLCDDLRPEQVVSELDITEDEFDNSIINLKRFYKCVTYHGIVYKHFISNLED